MPLSGPHHRFNAGSHVADQADLQGGPVAEVCDDPGDRGSIGGVHIRQPCEAERSFAEDGAEDRGSLADGSGPLSIIGGTDLHEGRRIDIKFTASYPTHLPELGEDRVDPQGSIRVKEP